VHGEAPVTKALLREAGMTLVQTQGDMWSSRDGELTINNERVPNQIMLHQKLRELKQDVPIARFLEKYFPEEKYARLRNSVIDRQKDMMLLTPIGASTFSLRDEWWLVRIGFNIVLRKDTAPC